MLFLTLAIILLLSFLALSGLVFLVLKVFKMKDVSFGGALKLSLVIQVASSLPALAFLRLPALIIPLFIASIVFILYFFTRSLSISWEKAANIYLVIFIMSTFIAVPAQIFLSKYSFAAFSITGSGMSPTLNDKDYVIGSKAEKALAGDAYVPERCEIVLFQFPKDETKIFTQRVLALPGERVEVAEGSMRVFSQTHPQGFSPDTVCGLPEGTTGLKFSGTIPPGHVFVVGDNRSFNASYDSREWGYLPIKNINAEIKYRLAPNFKSF